MNTIRRCLMALPLLAMSTGAYAAPLNVAGNYLVTLSGNAANGGSDSSTACAVLTEDGSTLGYNASGSLTYTDSTGSYSGFWFTRYHGAIFIVSLPNGVEAFSGDLGGKTIVGTAYIKDVNASPTVGGTFTAQKHGC